MPQLSESNALSNRATITYGLHN